ncbi:MAG: 30S ribosome-binding factor RbfA [Chloroflexi bacterium]|nr:30S ribosome-binding factor RbfA [Chloroflexota bacterium]
MQPRTSRRHQRLNDLLRDELGNLLLHHTRDPRLATLVSITGVELSPDMRYAKVYTSILGVDEEKRAALQALRGAERYLRRELGERITMRRIPELQFQLDESIERGVRISQLLKQVSEAEQEQHPHDEAAEQPRPQEP